MHAFVELDNFTEVEASGLSDSLMIKLQAIRYLAGYPIYISSGRRLGDPGAHGSGLAVDITDDNLTDSIAAAWRYAILWAAYRVGIPRIGIYDNHIHLDISTTLPQNVTWWGTSD